MKLEALDHPKILDLAARLGVSRPTAIGHLELLWAFTAKLAAQGNVGKWPDGSIARACDWMGQPEAFIEAVTSAGLLERSLEHRLVVHDWKDHAPGWVRAKLAKLHLPFISIGECTSEQTSECTSEPSTRARVSKPSLAKGSLVSEGADAPVATELEDANDSRHESDNAHVARARNGHAPEFETLKAIYPKRAGSNPWDRAEKAIHARLREGCTWRQVLDGAGRYAEFIQATGKAHTEFVMQAATFCGPSRHFLEAWDLPAESTKPTKRRPMTLEEATALEDSRAAR